MPMAPGAVICFGEILIDLIVSRGNSLESAESFDIQPGGAPANVAAGLARLGVPVSFCGVVGDDPFGTRLRGVLESIAVDISLVRTEPDQHTTMALAWKDDRGDGHFRLLRMADACLSPADAESAGIRDAAAIVVGSVSLAAEPSRAAIYRAVAIATDARVPVCFDVNMRPTLWDDQQAVVAACRPVLEAASVIKLSKADAEGLGITTSVPERVIDAVAVDPDQLIVLTDGARGAWAGRRGALLGYVPAFPVESVDPTGAGDAFMAALIARLIERQWRDLGPPDLRFAAATGALATRRRGGIAALPSSAEVVAFLDDQVHPA